MVKVLKPVPSYQRCARRHPASPRFQRRFRHVPAIDRRAATSQVKHRIFPTWLKEPPDVAKPDLGTKRLCAGCGAKFYDLNKTPIVCPKCETVFVPVVVAPRTRPDAAKPCAGAGRETGRAGDRRRRICFAGRRRGRAAGRQEAAAAGAEGDETEGAADDAIEMPPSSRSRRKARRCHRHRRRRRSRRKRKPDAHRSLTAMISDRRR